MDLNPLTEDQSGVELDVLEKPPVVQQPSKGFGCSPRDMQNNKIYYPKPMKKKMVSSKIICIALISIPFTLIGAGCLFYFVNRDYYFVDPIASASGFGVPLLIIIWLIFYVTCSFNGRRKFMRWLNAMYLYCCCRIDFTSKLRLADAIGRYEEQPILSSKEITEIVIKHPFLVAIMETLCSKKPGYFFSYLLSGSLREGFGKILPSTSILATDFDIMLVPEGVTVGRNEDEAQKIAPLFTVVENKNPNGYVWLKLEDIYLKQWDLFCLRRHSDKEGVSFLSSKLFTGDLKQLITESSEVRHFVSKQFTSRFEDVCITGVYKGPAFNIEVKISKQGRIWSGDVWQRLFDADFTLALHCNFWPEAAKGFFDPENRKHWPSTETVNTIRKLGCHVTPKASTNALVKLNLEQPEYTSYSQSSSLEWRYSFSQAEVILSDNIPSSARSAFLALKATNKRHFNRKGKEIPSYALKCILLSLVEKKPISFWENSNQKIVVEEFFSEMLRELQRRLSERNCPNYWIPQINLFHDFTDQDYNLKEEIVDLVIKKPIGFVADGYLEYVRYVTLNCYYCGENGYIEEVEAQYFVNNEDLQEPLCICRICKCSNTTSSCFCGPCGYDRVSLDVY